MAITPREKELAAVGIAVATGCKPCTEFHVKAARKAAATDAEIKQAMNDALAVRRGAGEIMAAYGLACLGDGDLGAEPGPIGATTRLSELVCVGAAFGVNCVSCLKVHLEAAERVGVAHDEIDSILKLSAFIKGKAASHVDDLAESLDKPKGLDKSDASYEEAVSACC